MDARVVLLVEDNPDDEALALRALRKDSIPKEVVVARDGVEALDYVFGTGTYAGRDPRMMPSLILLDIKLPKVNGLEVLRRLRSDGSAKSIPVVMLTNSSENQDIAESYKLGANSYIRKPAEFLAFATALQQVVQYWLSLNLPAPKTSG